MSILSINRDILGQFSLHSLRLLFLSISFSLLLLLKPSLFPAYHQTCVRNMTISNSFAVGLSWNLSTRIGIQLWTFLPLGIKKKNVWAERNTLCIIDFSFPAETQNFLSKTMIPDSLTVGLSSYFDRWFVFRFHTLSPWGFSK